jgi:peptidoglycan/LPS O-acetylase OafA/YrhL
VQQVATDTPKPGRLDHIDAVRPVKQAGVISTHVLDIFAPQVAAQGAALTLLHVSREAFFFVSACMLTYGYRNLTRSGLPRFYWRRFVSVGVPYLAWTVIYFLYTYRASHYGGARQALTGFDQMLYLSYYHLYFLLVIMQFYLVFPLVLLALRWSKRHHLLVIALVAVAQVVLMIAMHWQWLPPLLRGTWAQRYATTYVLYLIGGCVTAFHLEVVDTWLRRNARLVVAYTAVTGALAIGVYLLGYYHVTTALGSGTDPFQPSVIPFNIGAIACLYLVGITLARSPRTRRLARIGSDNSYGVYLSHMLFIAGLTWLGWARLDATIPWPLLCLVTIVGVYVAAFTLTTLLARTPLAVPLTGRSRVPLARPARLTWRLDRSEGAPNPRWVIRGAGSAGRLRPEESVTGGTRDEQVASEIT